MNNIKGIASTNNLESYWMPFTSNKTFKSNPRMLVSAEGMYYTSSDGRKILDGVAGLWCVNAGHCRKNIVKAVQDQVAEMDYSMAFGMGHPSQFELASRLTALMPNDLDHVFFANSGSEAVDTSLKIAIAYHRLNGEASRTRLIGREKGYHGVGFGGISVGGIVNNRKFFGPLLAGTDHLPATYDLSKNSFTKGQPDWGIHWADELEKIINLHDFSTVAAVIVEPVAGSAGVIVPPKGYLKRLREICDKYGVLLIFDEVITGFGRLGKPFATEYFDVVPDLITSAKGLTNGTVPMSAVFVKNKIYDCFMNSSTEGAIEFFHGYTYSGHPLACAAGLATLDTYKEEGLFDRVASIESYWEDAAHSLKGCKHVKDIRNLGLIAGIELETRSGKLGARAAEVFSKCYDEGVIVRVTGDTIALSPPLIIEKSHIDRIFETIKKALHGVD